MQVEGSLLQLLLYQAELEHADNSTPSPHPDPHPSPSPNMQVAVEGSYYVSFRLLLKIDSVRTLPAAYGHASHPSACLTLTLTLNHRSACRAPSSSTPQTTCDRSATPLSAEACIARHGPRPTAAPLPPPQVSPSPSCLRSR